VDRTAHSGASLVTTFVVLLRGVNVGGHNRLPMADLRSTLSDAGLKNVRTYIQSGNIVARAPGSDPEAVAAHVRATIAQAFHLDVPAIALTAAAFASVVDANPFPDEPDPRRVHAIVLPYDPTEAMLHAIGHRESTARAKGGRDEVIVHGRVAYLHTPDGFGASDLAKALTGRGTANPLSDGTARNWATMTSLRDMCAPA
jgi:uncharacterized protein (DUF1697 family)